MLYSYETAFGDRRSRVKSVMQKSVPDWLVTAGIIEIRGEMQKTWLLQQAFPSSLSYNEDDLETVYLQQV